MIAFTVRWVDVYWYWLAYLASFGITYGVFRYRWNHLHTNYGWLKQALTKDLDGLFLQVLLGVILWWRLWHVILYDLGYYLQNLDEIVRIDNGWMSFVWWLIGVVITIVRYWIRKNRSKREFVLFSDIAALILPLAVGLGRITNSLNQELRWKPVAQLWAWIGQTLTSLWATRVYSMIDAQLRVHTELLEALWEWVLIWAVLWTMYALLRRYWVRYIGRFAWTFCVLYAIIRFSIEHLKDIPWEYLWLLTVSQRMMIVLLVVWIVLLYYSNHNNVKFPLT